VDDGDVTRINAALAVQLCNSFLLQKFPENLASKEIVYKEKSGSQMLSPTHIKGLEETIWPGRFQVIIYIN
jgi:folylpolyglutamate synthase/dihydropteroate synthase